MGQYMKKSVATFGYSILSVVLMATLGSAFGQNGNHQIKFEQQLAVTYHHLYLEDELVSASALSGNVVKFSYAISMTGIKRKTSLSATYQSGRYGNAVSQNNTNEKISENAFSISVSDGFNLLAGSPGKFAIYVGYQIKAYSSYSWNPAVNSSKSRYSWFSYNTAALYQSYSYFWPTQSLNLDISIPVIGVVYRPESKNSETSLADTRELNHILNTIYSNPSFSSLHNNLMADLTLSYNRIISQRISLSAIFGFTYLKWTGESKRTSHSNGAGITARYRFLNRG